MFFSLLIFLFIPLNVKASILYTGSSTEGLVVLDMENNSFSIRRIIPIEGEIKKIVRHKNLLGVAAGLGGIYIFNISDPTNPVLLDHYDTNGFAFDLAFYHKNIYLADFEDGIKIFSLNGGKLHRIRKIKTLSMAMGIKILYPYLFVSNENNGLLIYNIKIPDSPKFIRSIDTPGPVWDVDFDGKYIYVAMKDAGFGIYDFRNAPYTKLLSQTKLGGFIFKVFKKGNLLYLLQSDRGVLNSNVEKKGVLIYNVTDPFSPRIAGKYNKFFVEDFLVSGNKIVLAMAKEGLGLLDISNIKFPRLTSRFNIGENAIDVWCNGKVAVVADSSNGAKVIDISTPHQNRIAYYIKTVGDSLQVCGEGNRAFITDKNRGVYDYDISNPYSPILLRTINKKGAISVRCKKGMLYVLFENYGIKVYKIYPRTSLIAEIAMGGEQVNDIAVGEKRLFLSQGWNGVTLVDISRFSNPSATSHMASITEAKGISARGKTFYLAREGTGMIIGDASNFYNIFEMSHVNLKVNGEKVKLYKNYALLAGGPNGLYVINISNPKEPYVVSHLKTPGNVESAYASGNKLCIADGWNGFIASDFSHPEDITITDDLLWFVPTALSH